jgi:hypothetical protein
VKEPLTESFVSWHQDLRYWGLDSDAEVSAWVALSPVTEANGCMRFVPGSHTGELLPHSDTFAGDNFLTRGQEAAVEIEEEDTVLVPLEPGQASFHHGKLLHASGPNRSDERRIGFAINYISTSVRQTVAHEDFAMLVRGEDRYGHCAAARRRSVGAGPGLAPAHSLGTKRGALRRRPGCVGDDGRRILIRFGRDEEDRRLRLHHRRRRLGRRLPLTAPVRRPVP